MALFLRGNVWWYELKSTHLRVVRTTGFKKKDKKKAQAVYDAARFGVTVKPRRSVVEGMLRAIYDEVTPTNSLPLGSVWDVYQDWVKGKSKVVSEQTTSDRRSTLALLVAWAKKRGIVDIDQVSVQAARQFVSDVLSGRANKTIRNRVQNLAHIWEACAQIHGDIHNPWKAACPDKDGTAKRRDDFTPEEREKVFAACREIGHDWYGTSLFACYTGLRYGDVATMTWGSADDAMKQDKLEHGVVDLDAGMIVVDPSKTRGHRVRVILPIADPLADDLRSRGSREGFVFTEHAMLIDTKHRVQPSFPMVVEKAGVGGYHDFHSWRHTFRSMLAAAGVKEDVARRMGGWTNLAMARHYDHDAHYEEVCAAVKAITSSRT